MLFRRLNLHIAQRGWHCVVQALAVVEDECVEVHHCAQPVRDAIGHARDHAAAIRVAAQHDVGQVLPADQIHDVGDVRLERDLRGDQVRALANACQGGREHVVVRALQRAAHALPTPAAVPGPVHENEGGHRFSPALRSAAS